MQRLLQCERQEAEKLRARVAELQAQVAAGGKGGAAHAAAVRAGEVESMEE